MFEPLRSEVKAARVKIICYLEMSLQHPWITEQALSRSSVYRGYEGASRCAACYEMQNDHRGAQNTTKRR